MPALQNEAPSLIYPDTIAAMKSVQLVFAIACAALLLSQCGIVSADEAESPVILTQEQQTEEAVAKADHNGDGAGAAVALSFSLSLFLSFSLSLFLSFSLSLFLFARHHRLTSPTSDLPGICRLQQRQQEHAS